MEAPCLLCHGKTSEGLLDDARVRGEATTEPPSDQTLRRPIIRCVAHNGLHLPPTIDVGAVWWMLKDATVRLAFEDRMGFGPPKVVALNVAQLQSPPLTRPSRKSQIARVRPAAPNPTHSGLDLPIR